MFSFQRNFLQDRTLPFLAPTPPPSSDTRTRPHLHWHTRPTPVTENHQHVARSQAPAVLTLKRAPGTRAPEALPCASSSRASSGEGDRELHGGRDTAPHQETQETRWKPGGAPPSGPSNTGRDAQSEEACVPCGFHRTTCLLGPRERRPLGARQAPASRGWEQPPRGQGSFSRASTVRHVSAEKISFCCHHMPCSPRQPVS